MAENSKPDESGMADEERLAELEAELREWRQRELRRMGFEYPERCHLMILLEYGEIELEEIRRLVDDKRWTPEQAWAALS